MAPGDRGHFLVPKFTVQLTLMVSHRDPAARLANVRLVRPAGPGANEITPVVRHQIADRRSSQGNHSRHSGWLLRRQIPGLSGPVAKRGAGERRGRPHTRVLSHCAHVDKSRGDLSTWRPGSRVLPRGARFEIIDLSTGLLNAISTSFRCSTYVCSPWSAEPSELRRGGPRSRGATPEAVGMRPGWSEMREARQDRNRQRICERWTMSIRARPARRGKHPSRTSKGRHDG